MIWLASFPRSGNTFFRIVLHEVYGIRSSTYHKEKTYPVDDSYEQYSVVKTHLLPYQLVPDDPNIPAVYVVRDGRDALVSIAHQRRDLIEPGSDFKENLRMAIMAAEGSYFGGWSRNVEEWIRRASVVVKFEDLIAHPIESVEGIRPILDLPEAKLDRLPTFEDLRAKDMPYGSGRGQRISSQKRAARRDKFFRRGKVGGWKDDFPEDLYEQFWELHGLTMEKVGYQWEPLPRRRRQNKWLKFLSSRLG